LVSYEILLMLDPELAEQRQTEIVDRVKTLVEKSGGSWQQHAPWGKRRLAYEIAKKDEGVYHLVTFDAPPEAVEEIGRVLKIDDNVMRHMAVRRIEGSSTAAPALLNPEPVPAPAPVEVAPVPEAAPVAVAEPEAPAELDVDTEEDATPEPAAEADAEPTAESVQAAE
jgi:small subunit ribosomal protein S6